MLYITPAATDGPTVSVTVAHPTAAYLRKVRAAGGIKKYERAHLNALTASFAPKFSHLLPPELVRRVVEYAFHVGDY